ncbi:MAG: 4Fe-4S dicluster domain-containing protein, partial [Actinobacteria bacterium]|nr:4Fe-4S dicluster domain-containing protein [Actinomycetota bacterium]
EFTLTEEEARAEAMRCLKCGCEARFDCDLRQEARSHDVRFETPIHVRPWVPVVRDHPFIVRDHNKCISCGRCVAACAEIEGVNVLAFQFSQGTLTVGTHDGRPLIDTDCVSCGQCVTACPCGALDYVRERDKVFDAMYDPRKLVVGFIAPAPRSVIAAHYKKTAQEASPFIAGMMRRVGFDRVFDFSFAADLTIMEEATEFLDRVATGGPLPQFTSCCPGWVNLVERRYPALIPHLSSCKSPQQMMGATVRNHYAKWAGVDPEDLFIVSIVPCLAKKYEAGRPEFAPEGRRDVDAVLTTTELIEMVNMRRISRTEIVPQDFDQPYSRVSGAGVVFAASGGVAEAALRMAVEKLTGEPLVEHLYFENVVGLEGFKEAKIEAAGRTVSVAVINGLGNAEPVIKRILGGEKLGYDFIEIMACPGGCIGGAGHPVPVRAGEMQERLALIKDVDSQSE